MQILATLFLNDYDYCGCAYWGQARPCVEYDKHNLNISWLLWGKYLTDMCNQNGWHTDSIRGKMISVPILIGFTPRDFVKLTSAGSRMKTKCINMPMIMKQYAHNPSCLDSEILRMRLWSGTTSHWSSSVVKEERWDCDPRSDWYSDSFEWFSFKNLVFFHRPREIRWGTSKLTNRKLGMHCTLEERSGEFISLLKLWYQFYMVHLQGHFPSIWLCPHVG